MKYFQKKIVNKRAKIDDFTRAYNLLAVAGKTLEADLVWSSDFESIRKPLAEWLYYEKLKGSNANPSALKIAAILLDEEFDLTI